MSEHVSTRSNPVLYSIALTLPPLPTGLCTACTALERIMLSKASITLMKGEEKVSYTTDENIVVDDELRMRMPNAMVSVFG